MAEHDAHYSPDGKSIAFASGPTGGSGSSLELIVIETNKRHVLHTSIGRIYGVSWSPDGSRIAFTDAPDGEDDDADVFVIDIDSKIVSQLTDDPAWDHMPEWHPDGNTMLFTSYRTGEEHIYRLDVNSRTIVELSPDYAP